MIAIVTFLVMLSLSIVVTRVASVALMLTGLSRETARFQARSAFTGVGYTTSETEKIVNHPVRRRIVMMLMLWGNVGLITVISTLVITFVQEGNQTVQQWKLLLIGGGAILIWILAMSRTLDRRMCKVIEWALRRWTTLDTRDYAALLNIAEGYSVTEVKVRGQDSLANKSLQELTLRDEGLVVLGIQRSDGSYVGGPRGSTHIRAGDTLLVYGLTSQVADLEFRPEPPAAAEAPTPVTADS